MGEYTLFTTILGLVLGTLFFYYDSKGGQRLYKRWHDLSSKDKLDPNLNVGFVNGQLFGQKLTVAVTISIIFYLVGFLMFGMHLFHGAFYALGLFVGLLLAFYLAPKFLVLFSKKANETIDYIESIEKGEKNITEEINKVLPKKEAEKEEPKKEEEKPKENDKPKSDDDKKDDDWRSGVKDFLDK